MKTPAWVIPAAIGTAAGLAVVVISRVPFERIGAPPVKMPPPAAVKPPSTPKPEQKAERDRMESTSQRQVDRSAESSDLSPYAKEQLLVAQSYSKQGLDYIERAKQYYSSDDFQGVCREFGNADRAMNAATESLVPVAREIQIKQPETMSAILRSGRSLAKDLESGSVLCRKMGFSWGG